MGWIELAQDRDKWLAVLKPLKYIQISQKKKLGISWGMVKNDQLRSAFPQSKLIIVGFVST